MAGVNKKPLMAPPCQGTDDITFYRLAVSRAIQQKKFVEYEVEVRAGNACDVAACWTAQIDMD